MKRLLPMLLFILILLTASCSKKFDDDIIAYVDGQKYTLDDLADFYSADYLKGASTDVVKSRANDFVRMKVSEKYLKDMGRFDDFQLKYKIKTRESRQLAQALYDKAVFNYLITPETYDELYDRLKSQKRTSHIMISFKNPNNPEIERSEREAYEMIRRIRFRANEDNFESLAEEYTDDPTTRNRGGDMGWLHAGQMIAVFDSALFATKTGQISAPFKTSYGYHIIYPKQERSLAVKSKDEEMSRLKMLAKKTWPDRFLERQRSFIDSLARANPITINHKEIEAYYRRYDEILEKQGDVFETLLAIEDTFILAEYPGTTVNKQWVIDYMAFFLDKKDVPRFQSPADLKAFIEDNHVLDLLIREGVKTGVKETASFKKEMERYRLRTAHAYYTGIVVFEGLEPTEEEIARYYVRNKEKYMNPRTVRVQEILVSDSTLAIQLHQWLLDGEDFATLAEEYTERPVGKRNKGLLNPIKEGQYGEMGARAFEMEAGELSEPIPLSNGKFSIINIIEFLPESPIPYDLVKNQAKSHLIREKRDKAQQESFENLYEKYDVQINPLYQP
jgi:peptidyl-prolyl cis-trans isomerase C